MANQKTFSLYLKAQKSFSLAIANFATVATWVFSHIMKISIAFVMTIQVKITTSMRLRKIKLTISKTSLIGKSSPSISLRKIRILSSTNASIKAISAIVNKLGLVSSMKERGKIYNSTSLRKISLGISVIVASFYTLLYYDTTVTYTLGDMDVSTLGDLDYYV